MDATVNIMIPDPNPRRERRLRIFWLRQRHALDMLRGGVRGPGKVFLPVIADLPSDARVKTCYYEASRQAFGVIVEHESFTDVPDGAEIPGEDFATFEYKSVRIADTDSPAVAAMNRDDLLKLRDEINTRLYDLEKKGPIA